MSNRARLRPPYPAFRWLAGLAAVPIIWGTFHLAVHHMPPAPRLYWYDYLKAEVVPDVRLSSLMPHFGKAAPGQPPSHWIYCVCPRCEGSTIYTWPPPRGLAVTEGQLPAPPIGRWLMFRASRKQFAIWLQLNVYGGRPAMGFLIAPLFLGLMLAGALFGVGYTLDYRRHVAFRMGALQLRGPELVTPRQFTRKVKGDGIGIRLDRGWLLTGLVQVSERLRESRLGEMVTRSGAWLFARLPGRATRGAARLGCTVLRLQRRLSRQPVIRIRREVENQHMQCIGDSGSGKTTIFLSITDEAEALGETCVINDPNGYFVRRYFDPTRGDVILGLDARAAAWNPCAEIDYSSDSTADATALAQAASMYPGNPQKRDWFFTSVARDVWRMCITKYQPTAAQLAELFKNPDPLIDAVVAGTELQETLAKNTSGTRASIIGTLTNNVVGTLGQIQTPSAQTPGWSAREWTKHRRGWIFLTSTQETREACSPLQRLWIDSLIMQLLSRGHAEGMPKVRMILDELPALGELGQLKIAVAEARKAGLTLVLGFQGRSQIKAIYGEEAEGIFSGPFSKLMLRTGEPESGEWLAKMIGKREVERIREHRAPEGEISYTTEQKEEFLVFPSELAGLENRCGYLRYGKYCVPIKAAIAPKRTDKAEGYIPRGGKPPVVLPMPNLTELRAKQDAERMNAAKKAEAFVWKPPAKGDSVDGAKKRGRPAATPPTPTQDNLWGVVVEDKSIPIDRGQQ